MVSLSWESLWIAQALANHDPGLVPAHRAVRIYDRMKAILLAAGLGTRLGSLTDIWPKCLMPVRGRPLLEYWLDDLRAIGINDVLINTHHHSEIVTEFLARPKFGAGLVAVFEPELLGTAGTLRRNAAFSEGAEVFVAHADNWCRCDLSKFAQFHSCHRPPETDMTMMTFATDAPQNCGIVETDTRGVVIGFHEKVAQPPGNLANAAVYILEPKVLDWLLDNPDVGDFSTGVLPAFMGRIATWMNSGYHRDIGTLSELRKAQFDPADIATEVRDEWSATFLRHPIHGYIDGKP